MLDSVLLVFFFFNLFTGKYFFSALVFFFLHFISFGMLSLHFPWSLIPFSIFKIVDYSIISISSGTVSVTIYIPMNGPYLSNFFHNFLMPCDFLLENGTYYCYNVTVEFRFPLVLGLTFFCYC